MPPAQSARRETRTTRRAAPYSTCTTRAARPKFDWRRKCFWRKGVRRGAGATGLRSRVLVLVNFPRGPRRFSFEPPGGDATEPLWACRLERLNLAFGRGFSRFLIAGLSIRKAAIRGWQPATRDLRLVTREAEERDSAEVEWSCLPPFPFAGDVNCARIARTTVARGAAGFDCAEVQKPARTRNRGPAA
jgi:hypothetical protein